MKVLEIIVSNNKFISDHSDIEWKFARSKLWLTYFEESSPLPPPFNLIPSLEPIYDLISILFGAKIPSEDEPPEASKNKYGP